jgi:hypothetical protein
MADPQNVLALDDLRIITGHEIRAGISTKDDILGAIDSTTRSLSAATRPTSSAPMNSTRPNSRA